MNVHSRELGLNELEVRNRLAELLALLGVLQAVVDAPAR